MQVAGPMDVGTSVQKKTDTLDVPMRGCEMQWAGVVAVVAKIRIRTVLEQQPKSVRMPHGKMQSAAAGRNALTSKTGFLL